MFAIEINHKTLEKIFKEVPMSESERSFIRDLALREKKEIYVRNYRQSTGRLIGHTWIPGYIIKRFYDFDPTKIKSDWDQIVRKEKK